MKKIEYYLLVIILGVFIINNSFIIKYDIDTNDINDIYCSNNLSNYNEYMEYSNNTSLILSKVKYRDIYKYKNEITIYKGINEGLKEGYGVINNKGLIGVITKCYSDISIVRLITNKASNISIKINDNYGILKYGDNLYIDDIIGKITIGDLVYTSGIGSIMGDILVGRVYNITDNKIFVDPVVNINKINYLYVLGDKND